MIAETRFKMLKLVQTQMYSRLSRCSTARGSSTGLSLVGPTKVRAHKSCFPVKLHRLLTKDLFFYVRRFEDDKIIS